MPVIRIMTKEENLKKAMLLHDQQYLNTPSIERPSIFNTALKLMIDASDDVFAGEKMTAASYSGSVENNKILELATKKYESIVGVKGNTRRVFDLAFKLYVEKFDKPEKE